MESAVLPLSPSLSEHSSGRFLDVTADLIVSSPPRKDDVGEDPLEKGGESDEEEEDKSGEFEFGGIGSLTDDFGTLSADELFADGRIRTVHEIFQSRSGLILPPPPAVESGSSASTPRPALKTLLLEERAVPAADELARIPEGTYCVWTPRSPQPDRCKKSNSTGNSSRRWRFRNILHRSNSDGKDTFVFVAPPQEEGDEKNKEQQLLDSLFRRHHQRKAPASPERQKNDDVGKNQQKNKKKTAERKEENKKEGFTMAHEIHYVKAREGDRRRSYLPYKQDLVGLLGNLHIHHNR